MDDKSEIIVMFQIPSNKKKIVYGTINYTTKVLYKRYIPYLHYDDIINSKPLPSPWEKPNSRYPKLDEKYVTYDLPDYLHNIDIYSKLSGSMHKPKPDGIYLQSDLVVTMKHVPYYIPLIILPITEEDLTSNYVRGYYKRYYVQIYKTFHELKSGKYNPPPPLPSSVVACPRCSTHLQPPPGASIFACPCGQHMQSSDPKIPIGIPVKKHKMSRKHKKLRR